MSQQTGIPNTVLAGFDSVMIPLPSVIAAARKLVGPTASLPPHPDGVRVGGVLQIERSTADTWVATAVALANAPAPEPPPKPDLETSIRSALAKQRAENEANAERYAHFRACEVANRAEAEQLAKSGSGVVLPR